MDYREILSHPRPEQPLGCMRDFVITAQSNTAMWQAAHKHVRSMGPLTVTEFAVQVTFACGHQQYVNLTKSRIRKRHWVGVIQRAIKQNYYRCYKQAFDVGETARKEVVRLTSAGQVATVQEAAELVTADVELRLAVYERWPGGGTIRCQRFLQMRLCWRGGLRQAAL
jgi:hypothetical protein